MRPYYEEAGITIYHGDCREMLGHFTADAVVADPPYGIRKAEWDDEFPLWWLPDAAKAAPVLAMFPGVWNLLSCPREIDRLHYRWTLSAYLSNGMTRSLVGFGNWIPCLLYSDDETSLYRKDGDCRAFAIGTEPKQDHPSPKPYRVVKWVVNRLPGESVIDPFMGSGTTLRAAKDLGRKAIGIEIEEKYCEIAAKRLQQEVLDFGATG